MTIFIAHIRIASLRGLASVSGRIAYPKQKIAGRRQSQPTASQHVPIAQIISLRPTFAQLRKQQLPTVWPREVDTWTGCKAGFVIQETTGSTAPTKMKAIVANATRAA